MPRSPWLPLSGKTLLYFAADLLQSFCKPFFYSFLPIQTSVSGSDILLPSSQSRPAIARPYAHVSESVRVPGSVQTPAAPPAEVAAASAPEKEQQPPTAPESTPPAPTPAPAPAPDAVAAAAAQASSSESPSVVDTGAHAAAEAGDNSTVKGGGGGDEAAQSPAVEEAPPPAKPAARLEPLEGEVTLRYNHYKHKFTTVAPPGRVSIPEARRTHQNARPVHPLRMGSRTL